MWEHGYRELKSVSEYESVQTPPTSMTEMGLRRSNRLKEKRVKFQKGTQPTDVFPHDGGEGIVYTNSYKQSDIKSAIIKHEMEFKHKIDYNNWNILYKDSSAQRLKIKESLAIMTLKPDLNANTRSTPRFIFPDGLKNKKKVKFKLKQNR